MTRLLLAFLLICSTAHAKQNDHIVMPTKVHCFKITLLLDDLKTKYGEEPIFIGKSEVDDQAVTMMFVNQQTGSYTVVSLNKEMGCVYDTGNNVRYRMPKSLDKSTM